MNLLNLLNLLIYMDFTIMAGALIVVVMENEELRERCNKIINK